MMSEEAQALWAGVLLNRERWDGCRGPHDLVDMTPTKTLGKRYRCTLCGGECSAVDRVNYLQGLAHGRAHPA